jgi:opacity protein-like surface antigen
MSDKTASIIVFGLALTLNASAAQAQDEDLQVVNPRGFANFSGLVAIPTGAFKEYVDGGLGLTGYLAIGFDRRSIVALRLDVQYIIYGSETQSEVVNVRNVDLGVDVTTTNDIWSVFVGPQFNLGAGRLRSYLNGGVGGSYFETRTSLRSSWENSDGEKEDLGGARDFYDTTIAWVIGGGFAYALNRERTLSVELAARYVFNGEVSYLRPGSIQEASDGSTFFTPIDSATNLVVVQLGLSATFF